MRVYSDGITKVIKGSFPKRFKLLAEGVEVPYLRTSDNSIRISGEVPFGFLDVQEIEPKKKEVKKPKQFDAMNLAVINKSDFDRVDDLSERLALSQQQMNTHLAELSGKEELLKSLETQNAQAIEDTKANMVEMAKVFGKEIQADRDSLKKATASLSSSLQENGAILSSKIEAHEKAINPHKITKATIGLERVDNTSDEDKPVSKKVKKELDKKADKSEVIELAKKIESTGKQQDKFAKSLDRINWVGGVGGNEIPTGGKEGQLLGKASNKDGDYKWVDPESGIEIIRVDELPETGETNTLYLVPVDDPETSNIYDEYIWAVQSDDTYGWEKIGSTEIDLSGYVPYTGATQTVDLNAQDLKNIDNLAVGTATVDSNEKILSVGQNRIVTNNNNGLFISSTTGQTRKGMYDVPMALEIQFNSNNQAYSYPLGFHDMNSNGMGGQFLFTSFSENIGAATAGDVMVENDKGGLIFNAGSAKSGSKMRFTVGSWTSTPQITVTANSVGIKNLNPDSSYALDVNGTINASTDVKINGSSVALASSVPTINSSNNYVPYRSSATAFSNSTLMYNSSAMAFTGKLHVGSTSPSTYSNFGRFTLYDNTPSQQVTSMALLNYGGGGGCGVAIDMYNTSANSGIPSGRFGLIDNGNYSGYLQLQVKKSGASNNPLLPAMNIIPVPATSSLTTCVAFGKDEFNNVLFDLHKPEEICSMTDSDKRWSGSGTTYSQNGSNKFNSRLMVAVGDIVYFTAGTEATVISIVSNASTHQITVDRTLGSINNQRLYVKKAYFKVTDENYNTKIIINPYGKMGLGTGTPAYDLDVAGTINASTDIKINGSSVALVSQIPTDNSDLTNGAGYQTSSDVASAISVETTNRENADIGLQQQIDAITASSDVKDIVGTYAQLQAYDTSTLGNNDIIKVLQDETHSNETTYYRWSTTTETFTLIGEEGPYYTKSEADSTFVPKTRTVNNKALSSNITLTASDVGALPDSTVIPTVNNATLKIQKNGTDVATFTANSSTNATANITVPTDTGDLTNGAGFITGITSSDVTSALGYTPVQYAMVIEDYTA